MQKTFAVIVTFNRPELLKKCIAALLRQREFGLSRIHVIVNSQDDETIAAINSFGLVSSFITYHLYDNPGPAGGFYFGLKQFLEEDGCEFVWLMDDDVIVDPLALQGLLACAAPNADYVFPKVIKGDGKEIVSFGWWGVLMRRSLVIKVGFPIPELFFWAEDTEYLQNRIVRIHKVEPIRCQSAVVNHIHTRNTRKPSWYYYYTIRNTLYYRTYIAGYTWYRLKRTFFIFPHSFFRILFKEDNKVRKLILLMYGIYHGLTGKIGKIVDPVKNR